MKRINNILIAALAVIALSLVSSSAQSVGYRATGEDGIAASPKLRQQLDEYRRNHSPAPAPAEIPAMACAKCTDKITSRVDYTARGANKPTVRVVTHLCQGCGTDWKIVGFGKAKTSVATHKCSSCGAENMACCNPEGGKVATKGMEKQFDVAPLK